jgi:hypothetical protein
LLGKDSTDLAEFFNGNRRKSVLGRQHFVWKIEGKPPSDYTNVDICLLSYLLIILWPAPYSVNIKHNNTLQTIFSVSAFVPPFSPVVKNGVIIFYHLSRPPPPNAKNIQLEERTPVVCRRCSKTTCLHKQKVKSKGG